MQKNPPAETIPPAAVSQKEEAAAAEVPLSERIQFRTFSMDGQSEVFYLRDGEGYMPVDFGPSRNLAKTCSVPMCGRLEFFSRKDGGFIPVFSVPADSLKDALIALRYLEDGSLSAECIDLSLDKMPLSSFSVVNLSPWKMSFELGDESFELAPAALKTKKFHSGAVEILSATLRTFKEDDDGAKKLLLSKTYSFWTNKRIVLFVFDYPNESSEESLEENDIPTRVFYNSGPRD